MSPTVYAQTPAASPLNGLAWTPYRYRGTGTDTLTPAEFQAELDALDPDLPDGSWRGRKLQPCGTMAAYRRHLRHKEPPCGACRHANSLDWHKKKDSPVVQARTQRYRDARAAGLSAKQASAARSRRTA